VRCREEALLAVSRLRPRTENEHLSAICTGLGHVGTPKSRAERLRPGYERLFLASHPHAHSARTHAIGVRVTSVTETAAEPRNEADLGELLVRAVLVLTEPGLRHRRKE
jgi:hypothetical protein